MSHLTVVPTPTFADPESSIAAVVPSHPGVPVLDVTWHPTQDNLRHVGVTIPMFLDGDTAEVLLGSICPADPERARVVVAETEDHLPCEACLVGLMTLAENAFRG